MLSVSLPLPVSVLLIEKEPEESTISPLTVQFWHPSLKPEGLIQRVSCLLVGNSYHLRLWTSDGYISKNEVPWDDGRIYVTGGNGVFDSGR